MTIITLDRITDALIACMDAEPAVGYVLSKDASQLGTVFAEMRYFREDERTFEALSEKQKVAYLRWSASSLAPGAE